MGSLVFIHASDGNNALLAKEVETRAVEMGHEVEHVSLNAFDFPVYTVAREQSTPVLEGLDELKTILDKGDAWFVFAPEYNGSYPPVLNNAIAWLSRDGDDFRRLFRDRTVALGTHSGGGRSTRDHGHAYAILVPGVRGDWAFVGHQQEKTCQP